jgi:hypothetical protein
MPRDGAIIFAALIGKLNAPYKSGPSKAWLKIKNSKAPGQPVLAPNGKTYRRLRIQPPARPEWMQAFCETDWTAEMNALNTNPRRRVQ